MRRPILLALITLLVIPASFSQSITVRQLEGLLATPRSPASDITDADLMAMVTREDDLAPRLEKVDLRERLTSRTRLRLIRTYKLGPLTQDALELLADRSSFLLPPPDEMPNLPAPTPDEQRTMIHQASEFVMNELSHLPNFFAVRTTTRFEDGPVVVSGIIVSTGGSLHHVETVRREVAFRDGKETLTVMPGDPDRVRLWDNGMQTQGEFGPGPAIVFYDMAQGSIRFDHWETGSQTNVAVYRYAIPAAASHYEIKANCRSTEVFNRHPAYQGTLAIDPAAGELVRLTLQAEPDAHDPVSHFATVIDYGPVTIGGRRYICPLRTISFSQQVAEICNLKGHRHSFDRPVHLLNRTTFSNYHRLGSEATILPGSASPQSANNPAHKGTPSDPSPQNARPLEQPVPPTP